MKANKGIINFHYLISPFYFPKRNQLKSFIKTLIIAEGREAGELNYIFCDDAYLLQINQNFLQHDTYTDIITFPYSQKEDPIVSDIYISIDRIRANAGDFKTSFQQELHRVIFHGALHLCGFKDKSKADQKRMRLKEDEYLNLWFHVKP